MKNIITPWEFFPPADDLSVSLSDCKSPQVFSTLLSILADLDKAVVCMGSACLPISTVSLSTVIAFTLKLHRLLF